MHSDESLHLLATCYYRSGRLNEAHQVLKERGCRTPQNRFLMARCCADLNKLAECEAVLCCPGGRQRPDPRREMSAEEAVEEFGDAAAFALRALAGVYGATERRAKAAACERGALRLNPLLWGAFQALCDKGDAVDPAQCFTTAHLDTLDQCHGVNSILSLVNKFVTSSSAAPTSSSPSHPTPVPAAGGVAALAPSVTVTSTPNLPSTPLGGVSTPPLQAQLAAPTSTVAVAAGQTTPAQMMTPLNVDTETPMDTTVETTPAHNTMTPVQNSRMMSGIGTLNFSTDSNTSAIESMHGRSLRCFFRVFLLNLKRLFCADADPFLWELSVSDNSKIKLDGVWETSREIMVERKQKQLETKRTKEVTTKTLPLDVRGKRSISTLQQSARAQREVYLCHADGTPCPPKENLVCHREDEKCPSAPAQTQQESPPAPLQAYAEETGEGAEQELNVLDEKPEQDPEPEPEPKPEPKPKQSISEAKSKKKQSRTVPSEKPRKSFSKVTMSKPPLESSGGSCQQVIPNMHIHVCGNNDCQNNCIGLTFCEGKIAVEQQATPEDNLIAQAKGRRSNFYYYMADQNDVGSVQQQSETAGAETACHTHLEKPEKFVAKLIETKLVEERVVGSAQEVECCDAACDVDNE